jgi:hypothetical protein
MMVIMLQNDEAHNLAGQKTLYWLIFWGEKNLDLNIKVHFSC